MEFPDQNKSFYNLDSNDPIRFLISFSRQFTLPPDLKIQDFVDISVPDDATQETKYSLEFDIAVYDLLASSDSTLRIL